MQAKMFVPGSEKRTRFVQKLHSEITNTVFPGVLAKVVSMEGNNGAMCFNVFYAHQVQ